MLLRNNSWKLINLYENQDVRLLTVRQMNEWKVFTFACGCVIHIKCIEREHFANKPVSMIVCTLENVVHWLLFFFVCNKNRKWIMIVHIGIESFFLWKLRKNVSTEQFIPAQINQQIFKLLYPKISYLYDDVWYFYLLVPIHYNKFMQG